MAKRLRLLLLLEAITLALLAVMTLAVLLTTSAPFDIRFENMLIDMIVIINIIKLIGQQADGSSIGLLSTTPFFESILI